jgi:hypothetical protein
LISMSGLPGYLGCWSSGDGVDVFGIGRVRQIDTGPAGLANDLLDQVMGAIGAFLSDDAINGVHPFFGFLRIKISGVRQGVRLVSHVLSPSLVAFCFAHIAKQL